ncbi:hypothetical protein B296_00001857 [Ensete ventricosum]|uniref:Uncharacterized protein n=1 Tax=Ensete ventricosum TaxID=4639 RepID=A0A427AUL4_ENSVE|nr:hypothetical protein B296_00001857 [Ensete ventricosum]
MGKQQSWTRRRGRGKGKREEVVVVRVRDAGRGPHLIVHGDRHLPRDERRAAQRARPLAVLQPPVEAATVEDVPAVAQAPDLLRSLELVQADHAAVPDVLPGRTQLLVPHHRERLSDQHRRHRRGLRRLQELLVVEVSVAAVLRPGGVGVEEVSKADRVEGPEDEPPHVAEDQGHVEDDPRHQQLRVADRKPHADPKGGTPQLFNSGSNNKS